MAHFIYTKPGGTWANGVDNIDASSLGSFETKMFKAINGDDGGTWTPTNPIIIGGAGLQFATLSLTQGTDAYAQTFAALKAIGGTGIPFDGMTCYVKENGIYVYLDPDSTAELQPWIVAPAVGTGRWHHTMQGLRNVSYGFAALDVNGKVPALNAPYGLLARMVASSLTPIANPSATSAAIGGSTLIFNAVAPVAGDIYEIEASGYVANTVAFGGSVTCYAQASNDGATWTNFTLGGIASVLNGTTGYNQYFTLIGEYVATSADATAGQVQIRLSGNASSSTTGTSLAPTFMRVRQIRK